MGAEASEHAAEDSASRAVGAESQAGPDHAAREGASPGGRGVRTLWKGG